MPDTEIGRVNDYFAKIEVAGIDLSDSLTLGDTIRIAGHTTDFSQTVESMQVEHGPVEHADAGQAVGKGKSFQHLGPDGQQHTFYTLIITLLRDCQQGFFNRNGGSDQGGQLSRYQRQRLDTQGRSDQFR